MVTTAAAPIFTAAALWLEDGDVIRPFASAIKVRGIFAEAPGWVRIVAQHVENIAGDPAMDVYTFVAESTRAYDVYAAADAA